MVSAGPAGAEKSVGPTAPPERIICAAHELDGRVVLCMRHCDSHAQWVVETVLGIGWLLDAEQGFYTNRRRYVSRTEAWKIAEAQGQILRRVGGDTIDGGTLFSENLY